MDNLKNWGRRYISGRVVLPTDAVMFDIDDTLIFTNGEPNVIITARPGLNHIIKWTIDQLKSYKIPYDYLGFASAQHKTVMKKQLPYNFILSVGDMPTDLTDSKHILNISSFYHN